MGVVVRRYIDIIIMITFPYSTCTVKPPNSGCVGNFDDITHECIVPCNIVVLSWLIQCYMVYKLLLKLEVIKERCLLSRRSMLGSQVIY